MRIRRQRRARLLGTSWFINGTSLQYCDGVGFPVWTSPTITIDPSDFSYGDYTYTTTMPITSLGVISSAHTNPV